MHHLEFSVEIQDGLTCGETLVFLQIKMGPKKSRRVRKIVVPTDTPTEFGLGDTAADIQRRREKRERERVRKRQRNRGSKPGGGNYTLTR